MPGLKWSRIAFVNKYYYLFNNIFTVIFAATIFKNN
jgi:hypothetical protein